MKVIEVRFSAKDRKCLSLKPKRFLVATENVIIAEDIAWEELRKTTKHWARYEPISMFKNVIEVK